MADRHHPAASRTAALAGRRLTFGGGACLEPLTVP
jgi:hypothetical protein